MAKNRLYVAIARLFPKKYYSRVDGYLHYAGEYGTTDHWLGSGTIVAMLAAAIVAIAPWALYGGFSAAFLLSSLFTFMFLEFFIYILIYLKMEDRTRRIETVLPDALQLISANLRAGMTPFVALKQSIRKEFGPLADELKFVTSTSQGTESFATALEKMLARVNSDMLARTIKLFNSATKSGGHLAQLLDDLAEDIIAARSLKQELVTSTKTYTAFILFTIIIGAPLLLAISVYFVDVITVMQAKTSASTAGFGLDFLAGKVSITVDFLVKESIVMLFITGLLASMLLGVIKEGKAKQGLPFAPVIIIASIAVFFIAKYLIANVFGSVF